MKKETIIIDVKTDKAVKNVDKLNESVKETGKETKNTSQDIDRVTGGAATKFKNLTRTVGGVIKSFKSLRVAIIASGVGALVLAVVALGQAFTRSEEGQNKFAKIMGVIGSTVNVFLDALAGVGEKIISAFENPKQALIDFKNAFIENITNRFNAAIDTLGYLGGAMKKVFEGDFSGAMEDAKKAGNSYVDTLTGVEDSLGKVSNAVKGLKDEITEEGRIAAKIADDRAKADKIERKNTVDRAKANQQISELRFKAEQRDKFTAAERVKFLKDASALEEEITNKEIEAATLRFEAKKAENALGKSTKADKDEEARLEAELIALTTSKLNLQKRLQTSITTFQNEQKAEKAAEIKAEEDRQKGIDSIIKSYEEKRKTEAADSELKKIELEEQKKIAELERLNATEEEKQQILDYYSEKKVEAKGKENDALKALNDQKLQEEIAQTQAEEQNRQKQYAVVGNAIGNLQNIFAAFGKESKALAIAGIVTEQVASISKIISNTGIANAKAVAASPVTFGQPWVGINSISAGLSIAGSVAGAVKAISDLKANKKTAGTPSGAPKARTSGGGARTPSFNIVGSSPTNQLAEAIGSQTQKPVKAYVVSNDVTTAQELDRNIVESASL